MPESNSGHDQPQIATLRVSDIQAQFPDTLSGADEDQVTRRVKRILGAIDELRAYPLTNSDEPAPVFRPIGKEQP